MNDELKKIEQLENKYLEKYYHFLKFTEDELLFGFRTKYKIEGDWKKFWNSSDIDKGISDFSTGAERIVYSLFNGKCIGQPNSSPVGSDLFFEVEDAFIHIDLKTVQIRNIDDYKKNIFVGNNQNSYNGKLIVGENERIYDGACLPFYYTLENNQKKICLTYFITILYEEKNLDIINLNILSMPNGKLYDVYGGNILSAGKIKYADNDPKRNTHAKSIRYSWSKAIEFKLLENAKRIKVIYFDDNTLDTKNKVKLDVIKKIYMNQGDFR